MNIIRYPPNWATEIVPRILKRARNKCEICGLENGATIYSAKFNLILSDGQQKLRAIWFRLREDAEKIDHLCESIVEVKVVLTVAHLDHDEYNHKATDNRLKALCQYCHFKYDSMDNLKRSKIKPREVKKYKKKKKEEVSEMPNKDTQLPFYDSRKFSFDPENKVWLIAKERYGVEKKLFILAGNYKQAEKYARVQGFRPCDWKYLYDPQNLCGSINPKVIRVGTWYNKDSKQLTHIDNLVKAYNGTIETVYENGDKK